MVIAAILRSKRASDLDIFRTTSFSFVQSFLVDSTAAWTIPFARNTLATVLCLPRISLTHSLLVTAEHIIESRGSHVGKHFQSCIIFRLRHDFCCIQSTIPFHILSRYESPSNMTSNKCSSSFFATLLIRESRLPFLLTEIVLTDWNSQNRQTLNSHSVSVSPFIRPTKLLSCTSVWFLYFRLATLY